MIYYSGIKAIRDAAERARTIAGLKALRADLDAGRWPAIRASAYEAVGDYAFIVARC